MERSATNSFILGLRMMLRLAGEQDAEAIEAKRMALDLMMHRAVSRTGETGLAASRGGEGRTSGFRVGPEPGIGAAGVDASGDNARPQETPQEAPQGVPQGNGQAGRRAQEPGPDHGRRRGGSAGVVAPRPNVASQPRIETAFAIVKFLCPTALGLGAWVGLNDGVDRGAIQTGAGRERPGNSARRSAEASQAPAGADQAPMPGEEAAPVPGGSRGRRGSGRRPAAQMALRGLPPMRRLRAYAAARVTHQAARSSALRSSRVTSGKAAIRSGHFERGMRLRSFHMRTVAGLALIAGPTLSGPPLASMSFATGEGGWSSIGRERYSL